MRLGFLSAIADKKLKRMGFILTEFISINDSHVITYTRENNVYNFTQSVKIKSASNGRHTIISCVIGDKNTSSDWNDAVGLTGVEMKWFLIKMKSLGLYSNKPSLY